MDLHADLNDWKFKQDPMLLSEEFAKRPQPCFCGECLQLKSIWRELYGADYPSMFKRSTISKETP